ncbi:MAG: DinB family protein [Planctomycetaceae bacterium]
MNTRDAIRSTMDISSMVLRKYLSDLTDAELLIRPVKGCNHIAYQLGHLITSECGLLEAVAPGTAPALPAGFKEAYGKENSSCDDPQKFCSKQQYLELLGAVNAATLKALNATTDADLDQPSPESLRKMFPTVGMIYVLIATHPLMHAGQFVPVRRALNKPVLM